MAKNTDPRKEESAIYDEGNDCFLTMGHRKYKASMAYTKALFHFAQKYDLLDPISQGFDDFMQIWRQQAVFRQFIHCHAIDRYTRKGRVNAFFKDLLHPCLLHFFDRLIDNGHTELLPGIYIAFRDMTDGVGQRRRVRVISAFPLNPAQEKILKESLENSLRLHVILKNEVDPAVMGGFVCYTDSIKIDMSLKKDLDKLKSRILSTPCKRGDDT